MYLLRGDTLSLVLLAVVGALTGTIWGSPRIIRGIKTAFMLTTPLSPEESPPEGPRATRRRWFRDRSDRDTI